MNELQERRALKKLESNMTKYRNLLARIRAFLILLGVRSQSSFKAVASDVILDMTGNDRKKTAKFELPSKANITKFAAVVFERDIIDEMGAMIETLVHSESKSIQKKALQLEKVYDALLEEYQEAVAHLEKIATKTIPKEITRDLERTTTLVQKSLALVDAIPLIVQVDFIGDSIAFAYYLDLEALQGEEVWVVIRALVTMDTKGITYKQAVAVDSRLRPIRAMTFHEFTEKNAAMVINKQFSAHGVAAVMSEVAINLDTGKLQKVMEQYGCRNVRKVGEAYDLSFKALDQELVRNVRSEFGRIDEVTTARRKNKKIQVKYRETTNSLVLWLES